MAAAWGLVYVIVVMAAATYRWDVLVLGGHPVMRLLPARLTDDPWGVYFHPVGRLLSTSGASTFHQYQ